MPNMSIWDQALNDGAGAWRAAEPSDFGGTPVDANGDPIPNFESLASEVVRDVDGNIVREVVRSGPFVWTRETTHDDGVSSTGVYVKTIDRGVLFRDRWGGRWDFLDGTSAEVSEGVPAGIGDPVNRVVDLSGCGNLLTSDGASGRPVRQAAGVEYSGAQFLACNSLGGLLHKGRRWTLHITFRYASTPTNRNLFSVGWSVANNRFLLFRPQNQTLDSIVMFDGVGVDNLRGLPRFAPGVPHVATFCCQGEVLTPWIDGVQFPPAPLARAAQLYDFFTIGSFRRSLENVGFDGFYGIVSDAMLIDDALDDEVISTLHGEGMREQDIAVAPGLVDLFIVAGQSNADGRGTGGPAVIPPAGIYIEGTYVTHLSDPVGPTSSGSAWPAFANRYYALTGRRAAIVSSSFGSTSLLPEAAVSNWSATGTIRQATVVRSRTAVQALRSRGLLGRVGVIWAQGEQDAFNAYSPTTPARYEQALVDLFAYFKSEVPEIGRFYLSLLGRNTSGSKNAEMDAIRGAQVNAVGRVQGASVAFSGAAAFVPAKMSDDIHYSQVGYNEMGEEIAAAAAIDEMGEEIAAAAAIDEMGEEIAAAAAIDEMGEEIAAAAAIG